MGVVAHSDHPPISDTHIRTVKVQEAGGGMRRPRAETLHYFAWLLPIGFKSPDILVCGGFKLFVSVYNLAVFMTSFSLLFIFMCKI